MHNPGHNTWGLARLQNRQKTNKIINHQKNEQNSKNFGGAAVEYLTAGMTTAGAHLEDPRMKDIVKYTRAKTLTVESAKGLLPVSLDGEVVERKRFTVEVVPGGVNFALPTAKD